MAELMESISVELQIPGTQRKVAASRVGSISPGIEQFKPAGKRWSPAQEGGGPSSPACWKTSLYEMVLEMNCVPSKKLMSLGLILNLGSIGGRIQATLESTTQPGPA